MKRALTRPIQGAVVLIALTVSSIAAAQSVSIRIPEGTHGMQPNIGLVYVPNAPNGIAGMGWQLTGLPSITRVNYGRGINFDGLDTYEHSELGILVKQPNGTYCGQASGVACYRTKKE